MYSFCAGAIVTGLQFSIEPRSACWLVTFGAICFGAFLYTSRARQTVRLHKSLRLSYLTDAVVLVPLGRWSSVTKKGLDVALQLRGKVRVIHLDPHDRRSEVEELWQRNVVAPLRDADRRVPELVFLQKSKAHSISPMAEYVLRVERDEPDRQIVVVVPELAVRHWWQKPLHNYRGRFLKWVLYARGSQRIMVIDVPWYL